MAEISCERALIYLLDQDNQGIPDPGFYDNGNTLQSGLQVGQEILRLWDLDPKTSTVRAIIRNKIFKYLNQKSYCYGRVENREKLAHVLDEKLFATADSQLHYLNLSTLESRLADLLSYERRDAACHVPLTSIGSMTWSSEMPQNTEATCPAPFLNTILNTNSSGMSDIPPSSFGLSGNSEIINPSSLEYKLALNSGGLHSHSDLQSLQQLLPVSQGSHVESLHIGTQSHSSEQGNLLQNKQLNNKSQLSSQWSHLPQKPFDQLSCSNGIAADCQSEFPQGNRKYHKIHRLLLIYEHVMTCSSEGKCELPSCMDMKQKVRHIFDCTNNQCTTKCVRYKKLFDHYRECQSLSCICAPVRTRMKNVSQGAITVTQTAFPSVDTVEYKEHPLKRMKSEHGSLSCSMGTETNRLSSPVVGCNNQSTQGVLQACHDVSMHGNSIKTFTESRKSILEASATSSLKNQAKSCETKFEDPKVATKVHSGVEPVSAAPIASHCEQDHVEVQIEAAKIELKEENRDAALSVLNATGTKLGKPKIRGVSVLDTFTPEKIREHIKSLEQCIGQSKPKAKKVEGVELLVDQNSCSLCGMDELLFELLPRYCASCSKLINCRGVHYSLRNADMTSGSDARISICGKCYKSSGETVKIDGQDIPKFKMERKWNYAETDAKKERWVQCDKCDAWQHQICALFNHERKEALQAEYTCPNCSLEEKERGERESLPSSMVPGAKDLPTTMMSDHLEQWLFRRLEEERQERAHNLGKNFYEVPGAEGLTVRVVSSVDKTLEVKQYFLEVFKEEKYPAKFPYKSKAILLFQKIEGADVCLFGMYVQEYGSECAHPNQRHVCLSYIDSVKYFRPEIKAVTGEALRTFVYHEILIGYLDYCKKRGFTSCYIWACPSRKQDDYILYCHPITQKMPKSKKLREWYHAMIKKATKQKVVVEHSNLYDLFVVPASKCKAKVTAARLPYFDDDYWPGEAEILLQKGDGSVSLKKGTRAAIEEVPRAGGCDTPVGNPKDILLMNQLGEIFRPKKEDFIIVLLQHICKNCCQPIVSGKQWVCTVCKNFQLCEGCYCIEQTFEKEDRHPFTAREKHSLELVEVERPRADTDDKDGIIRSKFLDARTVFLSLCKRRRYQFDNPRRAKHSTMMILYHLHTPTSPGLASSCTICHGVIDTARSWHCVTCPDYDLCDSCYQWEGAACHDHKLISYATKADGGMLQKERSQQKKALQNLLNVLIHASTCHERHCSYPFCDKIKRLFQHSRECKTFASGGCRPCKKVWYLLQNHARFCNKSECHVPRCGDLKDHMRKKRLHSESHLRAGAEKRTRQQDGEASESYHLT